MIADPIGIPACFSSGSRSTDDPDHTSVACPGINVITSTYTTKLGNHTRVITISWSRNLILLHGLSVSISAPIAEGGSSSSSSLLSSDGEGQYTCKMDQKPWYFWKKGLKNMTIEDGKKVFVYWDFKDTRFSNGPIEPSSGYYVAIVYQNEVVFLVGDMRDDAYRRMGCRPALIVPAIVSKKEHIFGKKKFVTKSKFHEKGKCHDIVIECKNNKVDSDVEMEVRVDGDLVIHVKHLQWKFRGNESIHLNRLRVEVYWDVHDWLFSVGLRHALFIFKPIIPLSPSKSLTSSSNSSPSSSLSLSSSPSPTSTPLSNRTTSSSGSSVVGLNGSGLSEFCLFLYAWKVEWSDHPQLPR